MEGRKEVRRDSMILKVENVRKEYKLGSVDGRTWRDALKERMGKSGSDHNKRFTALDGVSFTVDRGETVGLIGSNGAGKSTLLKLISRITGPTDGRICIGGRVASMLEVGTGFHRELTGRENIYLNGSILGMSRKEIDRKLDSIIAFSECGKFIDTPVKHYSSGMYVKLAFAVAAHLDSDIMIMDEILAVGDVKFQRKCLNKMKEIAGAEGRTILYVSHNMETVRRLCQRCIVLDHGKIIFDGDTGEAIRVYLGDTIRTETSMDFTRYVRPGWLGRHDVQLTWGEYPGRQDNLMNEKKLELLLRWKANKDVEHMGLRVEIMDNSEHPFATSVFYDIFSGAAGDEGEGRFTISLKHVMNGVYQTFYTLFVPDGYQESVDLDCVRGLHFSIRDETGDDPICWKNQSWGNIRLEGKETGNYGDKR